MTIKSNEIITKMNELGIEIVQNDTVIIGRKFGSVEFRIDLAEKTFDMFAELKGGIYEIGELYLLVKTMLGFREFALKKGFRELNTTERLYPKDRRGKKTRTSNL